ncbi:MAG: prephenate dehydrogenase/arogenate dehydrogenase family protein, partial [Alphaproteobacteria bacterium]
MSDQPHFRRIALIGIGLIGSSIARGARAKGLAREVVGTARSEETRKVALEHGVVDAVFETAAEAVSGADLVILCVPVGAMADVAKEIAGHLKPGAIVTDVGSVKGKVVEAVAPHMPEGVHFVAGHPIAGTEQSGPLAGFAELFEGRWCILTPTEGTDAAAVEKLKSFWEALGSDVETMDPAHHDLVLAITSHVPHLIAYNIVGTAADLEEVT